MKFGYYINEQEQLMESSLSRIWRFVEEPKKSFGIVSSFRGEYGEKENEERHNELKKDVRKMGLGFIELRGGYKEEGIGFVMEKSLFIPSISKSQIVSLGKKYDQDSVMYKDKDEFVYIGTNTDTGIGKILGNFLKASGRENLDLNKSNVKDFFSALLKGSQKGRKFLFQMKESNSFTKARLGLKPKWVLVCEEE